MTDSYTLEVANLQRNLQLAYTFLRVFHSQLTDIELEKFVIEQSANFESNIHNLDLTTMLKNKLLKLYSHVIIKVSIRFVSIGEQHEQILQVLEDVIFHIAYEQSRVIQKGFFGMMRLQYKFSYESMLKQLVEKFRIPLNAFREDRRKRRANLELYSKINQLFVIYALPLDERKEVEEMKHIEDDKQELENHIDQLDQEEQLKHCERIVAVQELFFQYLISQYDLPKHEFEELTRFLNESDQNQNEHQRQYEHEHEHEHEHEYEHDNVIVTYVEPKSNVHPEIELFFEIQQLFLQYMRANHVGSEDSFQNSIKQFNILHIEATMSPDEEIARRWRLKKVKDLLFFPFSDEELLSKFFVQQNSKEIELFAGESAKDLFESELSKFMN